MSIFYDKFDRNVRVFIETRDFIKYGVLEEPFFKIGRVDGVETARDITFDTFGNIYQVGDIFLKVVTLDVVEEDDVVNFSESNALEYIAFKNVIASKFNVKNSQCMDKRYSK